MTPTKRTGRWLPPSGSAVIRLSGRTENELVEQLIWRSVGPDPKDERRRQTLLRWAGVRGPHVTTQQIADEHRVSRQIVSRWIVETIAAAPTVDLAAAQLAVLSESTLPREDARLRARRARLLHRLPPPPLPAGTARDWRRWNDVALRITAALGALTTEQIHAGVVDGRRRRGRDITIADIARALDGQGALARTADGGWRPATPTTPSLQDVAIVALVRAEPSQPIPFARMREILLAVGLKLQASGGGPVMQYHPLVFSVSYGSWALRDYETSVQTLDKQR